jgi:ribosome-associated translation inhibitor RaiA
MAAELVHEIRTVGRGPLPPDVFPYAQEKIGRVARFAARPVRFASVAITVIDNPSVERPVIAEAVFDIDGLPVRAHVEAHDGREAVDLLEQRLRRRVDQVEDRFEALTRSGPPAAATPGPTPPALPPEGAPARHLSLATNPMTPDEAVFDLDLLGFQFYLFTDAMTGGEAVVYPLGEGVYGVRGDVELLSLARSSARIVYEGDPPELAEAVALVRLYAGREPYVFYRDAATGRCRVAYRADDGSPAVMSIA